MPGPNQLSAYTIYDHSKVFVIDGKHAIIGSANLNDRSMLGTENSDAELDIEIVGPAAAVLLEKCLERYLGQTGFSEYATSGLARAVNKVAMRNNQNLKDFFGMDFAFDDGLFPGQPKHACVKDISSHHCCGSEINVSCADGIRTPCRTHAHHAQCVRDNIFYWKCFCDKGHCYDEKTNECVHKAANNIRRNIQETADHFVDWIAGTKAMLRNIPKSKNLKDFQWQGNIIPLTKNLWGDPFDEYWVDKINSGPVRKIVN